MKLENKVCYNLSSSLDVLASFPLLDIHSSVDSQRLAPSPSDSNQSNCRSIPSSSSSPDNGNDSSSSSSRGRPLLDSPSSSRRSSGSPSFSRDPSSPRSLSLVCPSSPSLSSSPGSGSPSSSGVSCPPLFDSCSSSSRALWVFLRVNSYSWRSNRRSSGRRDMSWSSTRGSCLQIQDWTSVSRHDSGEAVVGETSFPTETETMKRMSAKVLLDSFYTLLSRGFNSFGCISLAFIL